MSQPKEASKYNYFELKVKETGKKEGIDDSIIIIIIQYFEQNKISSTDVSLGLTVIREKCKHLEIKRNTLVKLFRGLYTIYGITGRCHKIDNPEISESKSSLVYIPDTQNIVDAQLIDPSELQSNSTNGRLYQLLKWTIRLNQTHKNIHCYATESGILFLVINSELHDRNGNILYMLCIRNDIISETAQKWQLVKLMTGTEIKQLICGKANSVDSVSYILPKGLRKHFKPFIQFEQQSITTKDILNRNERDYSQLRMIQTKSDQKKKKGTLSITLSEFVRFIRTALAQSKLIPIVSIISGKKYKARDGTYSIDQLLPVNIKGEWVGICYRYKSNDHGKECWCPFQVLFDQYDIINKAILYSPKFDANKLSPFQNNICKIEIISKQQPVFEQSMINNNKPKGPSIQNNEADAYMAYQDPPDYKEAPQANTSNGNKLGKAVYDYSNGATQNESKQSSGNHQQVHSNEGAILNNRNTNSIGYNNPILRQDGTATNGNTVNYQTSSAACFQNNAPNSGNPEIGQHQFLLTNQTSQITTQHTNNQPLLQYTLMQVQQQNANNTANQPQAAQGFNALNGQQIALTTTGQQANQIQVQQTQGSQVLLQSAALTTQSLCRMSPQQLDALRKKCLATLGQCNPWIQCFQTAGPLYPEQQTYYQSLLNIQAIQLQHLQCIRAAQVLQQRQTVLQNQSLQIAQNLQSHTLQYQQTQAQGNQNAMDLATLNMQNDQNLQQQTTAQSKTTVQQLLRYQDQYNVLQTQNGNNHAQNQNNNTQQTKGRQRNINNNGQQQQNDGNNTK